MAKTTWTKRSFAAGELSPQICHSRTDLPLYAQGLSRCFNLIPFKTGPVVHRPNTLSYPAFDLPSNVRRLIPFYLSKDTHILLVFGEETLTYVRVEKGGYPEVIKTEKTVYSCAEAEQLDYALCGTLMVLVHPYHPPHQIQLGDDGFQFSKMEFSPPPWLGQRIRGGVSSDAKLIVKKTEKVDLPTVVMADDNVFKRSDTGRYLRLGFHPKAWEPKTAYSENSFISMYGKVYQSTTAGISGSEWGDNQKDSFVKDGGIAWKVVYSNQMLSFKNPEQGSKQRREQGAAGSLPPYYVWGVIQEVYNEKIVSVVFSHSRIFTEDEVTDRWHLSAWGREEGYPHHVTFSQNRLVFFWM